MLRAARQNDKEKIEMLIKNCGDVNAASDTLGNTILMYSAQNGNEEITSLLIEKCLNHVILTGRQITNLVSNFEFLLLLCFLNLAKF